MDKSDKPIQDTQTDESLHMKWCVWDDLRFWRWSANQRGTVFAEIYLLFNVDKIIFQNEFARNYRGGGAETIYLAIIITNFALK